MIIQMRKTKKIVFLFFLTFAVAAGFAENRVKRGDFIKTIILTGSLKAQKAEQFVVPVTENWQIQIKWMAKEGTHVNPGDLVVLFDTSNLATEVENLEMSLQVKGEEKVQKVADFNHQKFELEVKVKQAEVDYKKVQLDASIPWGIIADYEYDQKQLELKKKAQALESARLEKEVNLAALNADIKRLEIEIREVRAKLEKFREALAGMTLKAKTAGTIVYGRHWWQDRKIQVGDSVSATWTAAYIPENESLEVEAWVNESNIQHVQPGQKVDLIPDAYPDRKFTGRVKEVLKSAEDKRQWGKAHYFRTEITLDHRDPTIMKPGMSVMCIVQVAKYADVLLIPLEMAAVDPAAGHSLRIKPKGKEIIEINPLDFNEFFAALVMDQEPALKEGTLLQRINIDGGEER